MFLKEADDDDLTFLYLFLENRTIFLELEFMVEHKSLLKPTFSFNIINQLFLLYLDLKGNG